MYIDPEVIQACQHLLGISDFSMDDALTDKQLEIKMYRTSKAKLMNTFKYGYTVRLFSALLSPVMSLSLKRTLICAHFSILNPVQ